MRILFAILAGLSLSVVCSAEYSAVPDSVLIGNHPKAAVPFDLDSLKSDWKKRILAIKKDGRLPIIDIESSFGSGAVFQP